MTKKCLNLGCGESVVLTEDPEEEWVNIDVREEVEPDEVCDVRELPFSDDSVAVILASDVLEHFSWRETREVLMEWGRVLEPGGELTVKTPNMDSLIAAYVQRKIPFQEFVRIAYGHQDYEENTHRAGFTPKLLRSLLEDAGFQIQSVDEMLPGGDWKNMEIVARLEE